MRIKELTAQLQACEPNAVVAITTDATDIRTIHAAERVINTRFMLGALTIIVGNPE
jgi:hypothetical protein